MGKFCLNKYQKKMPRGKAGRGGMGKRTKKGNNMTKRELWYKEEGQEYAQVQSMLGNGRLRAMCFYGKTRLATIRGKMRRRVYIFVNDIILVGLRDFQDEKCDVIWKYYPEEAKTLKALGEIPDSCVIDESKRQEDEGAIAVKFDQGEGSEDEAKAQQILDGPKPKKALSMPSSESESDYSESGDEKMLEEKPAPKKPVQTTSKYKPVMPPSDSESEEEKPDELEDI